MRVKDMGFSITADKILSYIFALTFLISPFLPDVKITRPKLMVFELSFVVIFFLKLIISSWRGKFEIKKNPLILPIFGYLASGFLFWLFSPNQAVSGGELRRVIFFALAFYLGSDLISSDGRSKIFFIWCFVIGSLWAALYGVLQKSGGFWVISVPHLDRVFSTFGNPIFFGVYLTITLPILVSVVLVSEYKIFLRLLAGISFILSCIALFYTATRASWIAIGVVALVYIMAFYRVDFRRRLILLILIFIGGILFLCQTRNIWTRQQAHLLIWRDTMRMWVQKPVFGVGAGLFHINFPDYASDELLAIWPQSRAIVNDAHNEYVQILSETGIVGFSVFLWVFVTFFTFAYKFVKGKVKTEMASGEMNLSIGIFLGVLGALVQNFFSVDMRFAISGIYVFTLMGVAVPIEEVKVFEIKDFLIKCLIFTFLILSGYASIRWTMQPYLAVSHESSRPDFFDEKILDAARTISDLESLAARYPTQAGVFEKLGWVYAKEKNFPMAIKNYEKAIQLKPDLPGPYNNIGNIFFLTNRLDDAIRYYEKSISVKPDQIDSRINLALAYYYRGKLGPAAEQIKEVLRLDPTNEKASLIMKKMKE